MWVVLLFPRPSRLEVVDLPTPVSRDFTTDLRRLGLPQIPSQNPEGKTFSYSFRDPNEDRFPFPLLTRGSRGCTTGHGT